MTKYTLKILKNLVKNGIANDITTADIIARNHIVESENGYTTIGYSTGVFGCNGKLIRGNKTGVLYAIIGRTTALFVF